MDRGIATRSQGSRKITMINCFSCEYRWIREVETGINIECSYVGLPGRVLEPSKKCSFWKQGTVMEVRDYEGYKIMKKGW